MPTDFHSVCKKKKKIDKLETFLSFKWSEHKILFKSYYLNLNIHEPLSSYNRFNLNMKYVVLISKRLKLVSCYEPSSQSDKYFSWCWFAAGCTLHRAKSHPAHKMVKICVKPLVPWQVHFPTRWWQSWWRTMTKWRRLLMNPLMLLIRGWTSGTYRIVQGMISYK